MVIDFLLSPNPPEERPWSVTICTVTEQVVFGFHPPVGIWWMQLVHTINIPVWCWQIAVNVCRHPQFLELLCLARKRNNLMSHRGIYDTPIQPMFSWTYAAQCIHRRLLVSPHQFEHSDNKIRLLCNYRLVLHGHTISTSHYTVRLEP